MPLVAVSIARGVWQKSGVNVHYLPEAYTQALSASGMTPVFIPASISEDSLRDVFDRVDGVVLAGGGDVNPCFMGMDESDPDTIHAIEIDDARDQTEFSLVRLAHQNDKPLLGICRGIQVMNVAMGGTLILDIPAQVGDAVTHQVESTPKWRKAILHDVEIDSQSRLAEAVGAETLPVNSIHHQAVKMVANSLRVTACASDGVIEGLEDPTRRFFLGVQWHPEEIYFDSPRMQALFQSFGDVMR
jgi:putative glutamine amidotransferase